MFDFTGKVILITGAGSGIGTAAAKAFARASATLIVADKRQAGLDTLEKDIGTDKLLTQRMDTTEAAACEKLVETAIKKSARLTCWSTMPASTTWARLTKAASISGIGS